MNYWKLMAGQGSRYISEFLDGKYIAVGFAQASVPRDANDFEAFRELVRNTQSDVTKGQADSWGSQLYRFYRVMHSGDRVLVYDPSARLYHVAEITSEPQFDASANLWHKRDVVWVGKIDRDSLSPSARNTLGAILTLFSVNPEIQIEIEEALSGKREVETVEEEKEEVQQLGDEIIDRSREFLKDRIQKLEWEEMQELVAGLLRAMGYRTRVSDPGPDRGRDIIASPDGLGLEDPRIHVEVKHRQGQMGADKIRAFAGGLRKAKGLYVSTGGFSKEAHYEADRSDTPLTLVDIDELARMIISYYDNFDSEARTLLPLKKLYWPL